MLVKSIVMHKYNNNFMYIAIAEAKKGKKYNEIPVGAVIVNSKGNIISKAYNCIEKKNNSTLHAEKIAIEKALIKTKKRYLEDCDIWVTLEPCMMCLGLIELTRIRRLYYGAADKRPVDLVCLVISPSSSSSKHLYVLSYFSRLLKNKNIALQLRGCENSDSLFAVLLNFNLSSAA